MEQKTLLKNKKNQGNGGETMAKRDDSVKKKVPELRFKGFTDDWEQRKLGDAVSISSGVTGDATLQDGKYRLTRIESISQGMLNVGRLGFTNEKPDQKYLLNLGDILYSNINSLSHIGKVALVDTTGIYHGMNLLRFQMRNGVDSEFLFQRLNTMPMKNWAVSHANPAVSQASINQTELSKQPISSPTLTEQQQIGNFFKEIDNTIALHQRKLDLLKEQKKGFLQKMFPKNGAKVPELRFAGFADDWEERKLSDISDVTKLAGFEFTKYVRYQESGKIIALRGLNVKNGKLVLDDVKYIDDSDFSKLNRSKLYKNDILLTYVGTVGELAIVPEDDKYYLAPNVARIRLQDHVSSIFVCQMMNDSNFYNRIILPLIATSSQPALSMENVRKFQLLMPDYQEQQQIS